MACVEVLVDLGAVYYDANQRFLIHMHLDERAAIPLSAVHHGYASLTILRVTFTLQLDHLYSFATKASSAILTSVSLMTDSVSQCFDAILPGCHAG